MNKYFATFVFYGLSALVIFLLNRIEVPAQDGGPGWTGIAVLLFVFVVAILLIFNVYKAFKTDKSYLIIVALHAVVLIILSRLLL